MKRQYVVIGLGIFGMSVAKTLVKYDDVEVIAIDRDMKKVEEIAELVTQANVLDVLDKKSLEEVGVSDCSHAIVAIGSHLESAILAILYLKELGVGHIVAKAKNEVNAKVLKRIGADEVIQPEQEMGEEVAKALLSDSVLEVMTIDEKHCIMEIIAPKNWVGKTLLMLNMRQVYQTNVLGIRKGKKQNLITDFDGHYIVQENDLLTVFTNNHFLDKITAIG